MAWRERTAACAPGMMAFEMSKDEVLFACCRVFIIILVLCLFFLFLFLGCLI
jgi:hypothetical protein